MKLKPAVSTNVMSQFTAFDIAFTIGVLQTTIIEF